MASKPDPERKDQNLASTFFELDHLRVSRDFSLPHNHFT
jgi:hypothetical protein